MSKGSSPSGNQTTTTEPPDYLKPFLQYGVQQATDQYQGGGPQYYPGNNVVPFSPQTEQALQMAQTRATSGSALTNSAQGYANDVLQGKYLQQGNPYADAAFNHAALGTQNQLASQFAGAGRNIEGSQYARGEQLNNLANQFYYQNYNDERNRQQQTVPYANQLANQDYTDIAQLANVGSQVEDLTGRNIQSNVDRYNFSQQQPGQNLDSYLGRLTGGYPGQQTSSPVYQNRAAEALGGALTGAQLGSTFGPWGTIIGGVGGGLLGGWS